MTTPKAALELAIHDLGNGVLCDVDTCSHNDCTLAKCRAAIPVAELESQAMELLRQYKKIIGDRFPITDFLQWAKDRDALIAKREALK